MGECKLREEVVLVRSWSILFWGNEKVTGYRIIQFLWSRDWSNNQSTAVYFHSRWRHPHSVISHISRLPTISILSDEQLFIYEEIIQWDDVDIKDQKAFMCRGLVPESLWKSTWACLFCILEVMHHVHYSLPWWLSLTILMWLMLSVH